MSTCSFSGLDGWHLCLVAAGRWWRSQFLLTCSFGGLDGGNLGFVNANVGGGFDFCRYDPSAGSTARIFASSLLDAIGGLVCYRHIDRLLRRARRLACLPRRCWTLVAASVSIEMLLRRARRLKYRPRRCWTLWAVFNSCSFGGLDGWYLDRTAAGRWRQS